MQVVGLDSWGTPSFRISNSEHGWTDGWIGCADKTSYHVNVCNTDACHSRLFISFDAKVFKLHCNACNALSPSATLDALRDIGLRGFRMGRSWNLFRLASEFSILPLFSPPNIHPFITVPGDVLTKSWILTAFCSAILYKETGWALDHWCFVKGGLLKTRPPHFQKFAIYTNGKHDSKLFAIVGDPFSDKSKCFACRKVR